MQKTNLAIDALNKGFLDGGSQFVVNVPGSRSQEVFFGLGGETISMNERVAYELAYGASLAGKRAVVTMKNVGMNASADPFLHSVINGVEAGLVVVLSDDVDALSSPERQDSRPYFDLFGGLWLEPNSIQMAYDFAYNSFYWSEKFDVPVVIRITNQFFDMTGEFCRSEVRADFKSGNSWPRDKYISYWKKRDDRLVQKNQQIRAFVETLYPDTDKFEVRKDIRFVVGNCSRELLASQELENRFDLYTYPLPEKKLAKVLQNKDKVEVFEQGNRFVGTKLNSVQSDSFVSNTGTPPDLSGSWPVWNNLEKLFRAIKSIRPSFVVGDEGQFTDESTKTIQVCLCMGSSVGVATGMAINGTTYPFCITGDASFLHGGMQTLIEALARGSKMGIVVLDNDGAMSTGGQKIIGDIHAVPDLIPTFRLDYQLSSEKEFREVLLKMRDLNELAILYIKY